MNPSLNARGPSPETDTIPQCRGCIRLGFEVTQRDEPHGAGHRQVVAQQVQQPDTAYLGKLQRGHDGAISISVQKTGLATKG